MFMSMLFAIDFNVNVFPLLSLGMEFQCQCLSITFIRYGVNLMIRFMEEG